MKKTNLQNTQLASNHDSNSSSKLKSLLCCGFLYFICKRKQVLVEIHQNQKDKREKKQKKKVQKSRRESQIDWVWCRWVYSSPYPNHLPPSQPRSRILYANEKKGKKKERKRKKKKGARFRADQFLESLLAAPFLFLFLFLSLFLSLFALFLSHSFAGLNSFISSHE